MSYKSTRRITLAACLAGLMMAGGAQAHPQRDAFRQWGAQTLKEIQRTLWLPKRNLYADEVTLGRPTPDKPAFMWGCGVQLSALVAATQVEPKTYAPWLRRYADALQIYWTEHKGIGGYDVLPTPKPADRYYDDNVWIVLALAEAYEVTHEAQYRDRAEKTFQFVMSGEDDKLGGGLYWQENERKSKNTCSNAPAAAAALRLHQITGKAEYLKIARRLYDWTNKNLQDTDGLFFDNVSLDGKVEKTKWSYNSALMIRANCLFYSATRQKKYLREAQRIARAAATRWVKRDTGAIADDAAFAHLLAEAFMHLYEQDHDRRWRGIVHGALAFLHDRARDPKGHYGKMWDKPQPAVLNKFRLIEQASAARAYWLAARDPSAH